MKKLFLCALVLAGCGSGGGGYGADLGDGGIAPIEADSGAPVAVPSCQSQPHGESSACRAVAAPYQFTCDTPPTGPGCKQVVVGSSTHMTTIYCCPRPEYP